MIEFVKYGFMFNAFVQQRELRHELISFFFFPFLLIIFGRFYLKQYLYKVRLIHLIKFVFFLKKKKKLY